MVLRPTETYGFLVNISEGNTEGSKFLYVTQNS